MLFIRCYKWPKFVKELSPCQWFPLCVARFRLCRLQLSPASWIFGNWGNISISIKPDQLLNWYRKLLWPSLASENFPCSRRNFDQPQMRLRGAHTLPAWGHGVWEQRREINCIPALERGELNCIPSSGTEESTELHPSSGTEQRN